jgi:hypothetical protein
VSFEAGVFNDRLVGEMAEVTEAPKDPAPDEAHCPDDHTLPFVESPAQMIYTENSRV